jgi:pyruvate formate-lyase activating enzyme-like uncharacterized protein
MMPDFDHHRKQDFIDQNRQEYGERYDVIRWPTQSQVWEGTAERKSLLRELIQSGAVLGCHDTKLDCRNLSPGCRSCKEGTWSCLFINNLCNGHCFFCPTPQSDQDLPTTNTVTFSEPDDYADYIARFGFRGVSISGGEPLLDFARTLAFLSAVRARCGDAVHLWIYTNGILLKEAHLHALKATGLDEIRFNLAATDYLLDKVKMAVGHIPIVTVEIPAIPEDYERLKQVIADLKAIGVRCLNLHQLRLTPHNFEQLHKRRYTCLHGPRVTVMESELTALRIMHYNLTEGIDLPINYCSFPYKNRYQQTAARRRAAACIRKPWEDLTETGLIRSLGIEGRPEDVKGLTEMLQRQGLAEESWSTKGARDRLYFHPDIWHPDICPCFETGRYSLVVRYEDAALRQGVSYRNPFQKIVLNENRTLYAERWPVTEDIILHGPDYVSFARLYLKGNGGTICACTSAPEGKDKNLQDGEAPWGKIHHCERIPSGLADYC